MKILFSAENFYPLIGGAEITVYTLFKELCKRNKIYVICAGDKDREFQVDKIQIYQKKKLQIRGRWFHLLMAYKHWKKILSKIVRRVRPDIVLTQLSFAPPTVKVAKENILPSILFIHDLRHICPIYFLNRDISFCNGFCWWCIPRKSKLQYVFLKMVMKEHEEALKNADIVIANSKYVADVVKKKCDVNCEVIYPFIRLDEYRVKNIEPRYVTFFNPTVTKGAKIVLEIAKKMKDVEFLVVGRKGVNFGKLPNVTRIAWVNDVKKVYSKTKILLVPSLLAESFGRVAVEAMANGIPCIVSGRGALPEVVGDAGIVIKNPLNVGAWINSINKLRSDDVLYRKMREKAIKQAEKFRFEAQYEKFRNILKYLVS